jgi:sporulation protein YqfC
LFEKLKKLAADPQALTLPVDKNGEKTELLLVGEQLAEVSGCRGLVRYTDKEIGMETSEGRLFICGEELELKLYRERHIAIIGKIGGVRLEYDAKHRQKGEGR